MKAIKYFLAPLIIVNDIVKLFVIYMPGPFGFRLRYFYYKLRFKSMGKNVRIDVGVHIDGAELISIGNNVYIDKNCIFATGKKLIGNVSRKPNSSFDGEAGEIIIGDNIHIAQFCILMGYGGLKIHDNCVMSAGCKVYSLTNTPHDPLCPDKIISIMPYEKAPFLLSPVVLHCNVWLGLNAIVMPSVVIEKNSFCVSNSLVIKSLPENSYAAGQPAALVRNRFQNSCS